jgi:hypothetical protein
MQEPHQDLRRPRTGVRTAIAIVLTATVVRADPGELNGDVPLAQASTPIGSVAYRPGRGLRVGDTGGTLGGYTEVSLVRDEGDPAQFAWDELSFFFIWDIVPRLRLFSESELEDFVRVDDEGHGGRDETEFTQERLYGDLTLFDALSVRAGKFLTPVGRWNEIHAAPLVWTTSRPLTTLVPFDPSTTGAMAFGSIYPAAATLTYSVFGQFVNQLDRNATPQPADRSGGARLEYARAGWSVGATGLAFENGGDWQQLGGLDLLGRWHRLELMGEFAYADGRAGAAAHWGTYLQAVWNLYRGLHLVGRYEHFEQRSPGPPLDLVVSGLAYKPWDFAVFKLEYLAADHRSADSPPGFKTSFALLF